MFLMQSSYISSLQQRKITDVPTTSESSELFRKSRNVVLTTVP